MTKIVGLALVFALPFYSSDPLVVSAAFGFALALLLIARAMPNLRKAVLLMVLLALSSTVLWSVFAPGQTEILRLGFLTVTRESLTYGIAMALRLNAVILAGLAFLSCTRIEELSWGLHRIGVPYALSFALSLAFRLVSLFFQTTHQIVQAQKARGLDLDSGPIFSRIRKHVPLLIPVFLYGVRNVDLMAMALESRGFRATSRRTHYLAYSIGGSDYVILLLLTALNAGCLWLRLRG